ncbi:MAG: hypothetical protein ABIJ75_03645 [Actinomycetota bacterium]
MLWRIALGAVVLGTIGNLGLIPVVPSALFVMGALAVIVGWCGQRDPWLGALAGWYLTRALLTPDTLALETTLAFVLGCVLVTVMQDASPGAARTTRIVVTTLGGIHLAFVCVQLSGYDPLWIWTDQRAIVHGITGNPNYLGAFLAISASIVPVLALPVWGAGIVATKSALAGLTFGTVLLLRFPGQWKWTVPVSVLSATAVIWWRGGSLSSLLHRLAIVRFGAEYLWQHPGALLWGFGPGAWERLAPITVVTRQKGEMWLQAHNEFLQLGFDGGVIALLLLAGWLWSHRDAWRLAERRTILVAILIESCGFFPFQVAVTAILCLALLGQATRRLPCDASSSPC